MDRELPTGTVTFLFTDIEGSTRLIQVAGDQFRGLLETHDEILRQVLGAGGGVEVRNEGDSFFFVFASAPAAVTAAVAAQRELAARHWTFDVKVRMGLHTGEGVLGGSDYVGLDVHRAARVAAAAHGGQIVATSPTLALSGDRLPVGASARALGRFQLKDLPEPEEIWQISIDGLASEFPSLRTVPVRRIQLPEQLTSFVGRRAEVEAVTSLLATARMVTLTGPGGTGKTRLSLATAGAVADRFPDGVAFVALDSVQDPGLVPGAVATVLALAATARDPFETVADYLRDRSVLLVLDNFEHVLPAARAVAGWLQSCPELKVLATSRSPLRITGETEYPVPPLDLPDATGPVTAMTAGRHAAVALFVERAKEVRPDFELDDDNAGAIGEIVARLDGLPLAIELAAARVRLLPPAALASRLASSLDLAVGGRRDVPTRQQTLRDAIEWSHSLLAPPEAQLFARFAVFMGGAGLVETESVCGPGLDGDPIEVLESLVDQSLIRTGGGGVDPRCTMLETIRAFAVEQLERSGEDQLLRDRHLEAYLSFAENAAGRLTRQGSRYWLDRLELEHGNLRSAFDRAVDRGLAEHAQRLVSALWRFWQMRGHLGEGRARASAALSLGDTPLETRVRALEAAAGLAYWQADTEGFQMAAASALELARDLDDPRLLSSSLNNFAISVGVPDFGGDPADAEPYLVESIAVAERSGDLELLGAARWTAATAYTFDGRLEEALRLFDRALGDFLETDAVFMQGWSHRMRGFTRLELGDVDGAEQDFLRGLDIFVQVGDLSALALHLRDLAAVAVAREDFERAVRLGGAVAALERVSETRLVEWSVNSLDHFEAAIGRLGEERAASLLTEARSMSPEQAIDYAVSGSLRAGTDDVG